MPEDRKYDYGYDGDGGPDNGNDGDLSEWIPVLIFLVCFPPVGVVLLVLKLMGITGKGGRRQGSRHPYDLQREASQTGGERRYYRQAQAVNQNPKKKEVCPKAGPGPRKGIYHRRRHHGGYLCAGCRR